MFYITLHQIALLLFFQISYKMFMLYCKPFISYSCGMFVECPDPEAHSPGHPTTTQTSGWNQESDTNVDETSGRTHTQESDTSATETSGGNHTQDPVTNTGCNS